MVSLASIYFLPKSKWLSTRISQNIHDSQILIILGPNPKVGGLQSWGVRPSVRHRFLVRARTFERKVIETWL